MSATGKPFLRCAVVGCPRIRGARKGDKVPMEHQVVEGWWFVCAEHWRPVRASTRRRHRLAQAALEKAETAGVVRHPLVEEAREASRLVIAEATELAMGISA